MPKRIEKIQKVFTQVEDVLLISGGGFCLVLMVFVFLGVLGRYVFRADIIPGNYAIIENYLLPLVVFLAFAGAFRAGIFPRLDMVVERLPFRAAHTVVLIMLVVELVVFGLATVYTWQYVIHGFQVGRGVAAGVRQMPLYPAFGISALGWTVLTGEVGFTILRHLYQGPDKVKAED